MGKLILAVLLPPLAVRDKGCGTVLLVFLLTLLLWVPGMLLALLIVLRDRQAAPQPTADYGSDIFSRAQDAKSQPLFNRAPSAQASPPPPSTTPPWAAPPTASPADDFGESAGTPPPTPPTPKRPRPPWEE